MKLVVLTITKDIVAGARPTTNRYEFDLNIGKKIEVDEDTIINVSEICEDYAKIIINSRLMNKEFIQYIIRDVEISITPNLLGEHRQYIFALS